MTLVVDALAGEYLEQGRVDAMVVGADTVLESGLVNKCGTVGLARVAGLRKVPVFALAGRDKFLSPPLAHHILIRSEDEAEVWPRHPPASCWKTATSIRRPCRSSPRSLRPADASRRDRLSRR